VLRLARNRLQSLPEALGAFSGLQVLDCSGNRLTSVPRVVGRCLALQQLLMSSNRLRGLTSGIGNLVRLQLLDLSHNQYRHLPTMTGDLTQLRVSRDRRPAVWFLHEIPCMFVLRSGQCGSKKVYTLVLPVCSCVGMFENMHFKHALGSALGLADKSHEMCCVRVLSARHRSCCWPTTNWRTCPAAAAPCRR
jgi:hypothetical protein